MKVSSATSTLATMDFMKPVQTALQGFHLSLWKNSWTRTPVLVRNRGPVPPVFLLVVVDFVHDFGKEADAGLSGLEGVEGGGDDELVDLGLGEEVEHLFFNGGFTAYKGVFEHLVQGRMLQQVTQLVGHCGWCLQGGAGSGYYAHKHANDAGEKGFCFFIAIGHANVYPGHGVGGRQLFGGLKLVAVNF